VSTTDSFLAIYTLRLEERPSRACGRSRRDPQQRLLAEGGNQGAARGQHVAAAEAAAVCEQRAVLPEQKPRVGAEWSMKPDRVRGDRRREPRAVASIADAVHRSKSGTDERQIRPVSGERRRQCRLDGGRAHPYLVFRRARGGSGQVDGGAGFPRDQVERDLVLGTEHRRYVVDRLTLGTALDDVHADRGGGDDPAALACSDGHGGEGATFVVAGGAVVDRFLGTAFACKDCVLGFDGLVRTDGRRDLDELAEELPAEYAVVFQALIAALELGYRAFSGALRRHRAKIKACEQIGPEIGHSLSVSPVLRQ